MRVHFLIGVMEEAQSELLHSAEAFKHVKLPCVAKFVCVTGGVGFILTAKLIPIMPTTVHGMLQQSLRQL